MDLVMLAPDLAKRFNVSGCDVGVYRQGNFSLALLFGSDGAVRSFGIAKRNVCDQEQYNNGMRLAIARALRRLRGGDEG